MNPSMYRQNSLVNTCAEQGKICNCVISAMEWPYL